MIDGVKVSPRRVIADPRGDVLHMLKRTDDVFGEFGEVYFSKVNAGQSKSWRRHLRATSQLAVPVGLVHFVLFDDRSQSPTRGERGDLEIGETNHHLLTIPPFVWYAFENTGTAAALIGSCASLPHDPSESERREFADPRMPPLRRS
ncbi:MAG: dTDP-4-dehydrorhamnose 3,5-epimerase [Actinomycetota bacterium]